MIKFSIISVLILLLSACGQTGPLYLPGTPPPIHVEPEPEKPEQTTTEPTSEQE